MVGIGGGPGESFSGRCGVPLNQVYQVKIAVFVFEKVMKKWQNVFFRNDGHL